MSELLDRRAQKKAQTREQIRTIAHRLFEERGFEAVTIADIARRADVAVQTVFNHFATKEELFFDGRVTWIDGPATAVRSRAASVPPLTALRGYLVELAAALVASLAVEERRRYTATLLASDALRAYERELIFEAERRLSAALAEAWTVGDAAGHRVGDHPASDVATAADLTAALWCSAVRVLVHAQRPRFVSGACPTVLAAAVEQLTADLLARLEDGALLPDTAPSATAPATGASGRTGWPLVAQRAG